MVGYTCNNSDASSTCTMTDTWSGGSTVADTTQNLAAATYTLLPNSAHATYLEQNSTTGVVTAVPLQPPSHSITLTAPVGSGGGGGGGGGGGTGQFCDGAIQTTYTPPKGTNMHDHGLICFGLGILTCYLLMKWRPSFRLGELSDENKQAVTLSAHVIGLVLAALTGAAIITALFVYIIGSI